MTKIKVIGVCGSGSNTISRMVRAKLRGPELIALNTDEQALRICLAPQKILIGENITKGLGAGMDTFLGEKAALSSKGKIADVLKGADMVFVTCGLGGGTGSSGAPIVAQIAKGLGILTIAVVTTPFFFEGIQRKNIANLAIKKLKDKVDGLLVIPNDKLVELATEKTTVANSFFISDEVLKEAVQGVTDLILTPGIINVDFADVKAIMKNSNQAFFGIGRAKGENRAPEAAERAINSPLLDFSINKEAKGILFNVSGRNISLAEVNTVARIITKNANRRAKIIFGAIEDRKAKKDEIKLTVIATGF